MFGRELSGINVYNNYKQRCGVYNNIKQRYMTDNSVMIYWDPIMYEDCAMNTTMIVYKVSVTSSDGQASASSIAISRLTETSAMISNISPGQEYNASVTVARVDRFGITHVLQGAIRDYCLQ